MTRSQRMMAFAVAFATAAVAGLMVGSRLGEPRSSAPGSVLARPMSTSDLQSMGQAFADIASAVTPAVVNINTMKLLHRRRPFIDPFFQQFFGDSDPFGMMGPPQQPAESLGSGVIIDPKGYVITNHHVVEGAEQITVTLADRREFAAELRGIDPTTDIALLKIEAANLPSVRWGDSDKLRVGEWVIAIGSPFGLSQTVTAGIVSAKGRKDIGISGYEDFIQTDAAINPGNSGGALVNTQGLLVGINTAIFSESGGYDGIGFAIPERLVHHVVDELRTRGRVVRGWLGIIAKPVTPAIAARLGMRASTGVVVVRYYRDSPAARARILPYTVIVKYNGTPIDSPATLRYLVADTPVGTKARLEVIQEGRTRTVTVTIGEHPSYRDGTPAPGI